MKTINRKLLWLCIGVGALCVAAAAAWPSFRAWSSPAQSAAAPAPGELAFQGALAHNWNGTITDHCDFRFQLWDAEVNGAPEGEAIELDNITVRQGAFDLALPAARLGDAGLSSWLAVGVRCGGEAEWETLAPRMQHQALAVAGAAAEWGIPETAVLICSVPGTDATAAAAEHEPVIAGVSYTLEGGFRSAVAGGAR